MICKFLKEYNQVKDIFVSPKKRCYFGKLTVGSPYFYPRWFVDTIINFRKLKLNSEEESSKIVKRYHWLKEDRLRKNYKFRNLPLVRRSKDWVFKLFGNYYWLQIGWPVMIGTLGLGWKDKFNTPRHEWNPQFYIYFFKWQLIVWWDSPDRDYHYWEQILWYLYYQEEYDKENKQTNIHLARKEWPWSNNGRSTWKDEYLR